MKSVEWISLNFFFLTWNSLLVVTFYVLTVHGLSGQHNPVATHIAIPNCRKDYSYILLHDRSHLGDSLAFFFV